MDDSDETYEDSQFLFSNSQLQIIYTPKGMSMSELLQPANSPVANVQALDMLYATASPGEKAIFKPWMRPIEAYNLGMTEGKKDTMVRVW